LDLCPALNDSLLNNYNPAMTLGWLANTVNYISKYCSKAETKSVPYKEMLGAVIPYSKWAVWLLQVLERGDRRARLVSAEGLSSAA
jgi:hypothetical protein